MDPEIPDRFSILHFGFTYCVYTYHAKAIEFYSK